VQWRKPRAPNFAAQPQALSGAAMIADEKAARQKKHEKRIVFHAFLLFKHRKRAFMKSEARAAFPLPTIKTAES